MKNINFVFSLLLFMVVLSSCEKGAGNKIATVGYGTSFGMCADYCVKTITVNEGEVVFVKQKNGKNPDPKTCKISIDQAEFTKIKALFADPEIARLPDVIGCPDCADGGSEWVEVSSGGKNYKITFEYGKAPKALQPAVEKLKATLQSFNNCN